MPERSRKCPYCAEEIRAEAIRCPFCRSRLGASDRAEWYRGHPERRVAGVAAAVAHALAFPIMGVRLAFVALTFVHFLGAIVYGALWLLVPFTPGEPSPLERGLATAQEWVGHLRGATTPPPRDVPSSPPANGHDAVPGSPLV